MSVLKERISDPLILKLIKTGFDSKIFGANYIYPNKMGILEGGILSTLLSNIYLDQFDIFMNGLNEKYKGVEVVSKKKVVNFVFFKLKIKKQINIMQNKQRSHIRLFKKGFRSIIYLRYADIFIVGINGSKDFVREIQNELLNFLLIRLKLKSQEIKTKVIHLSKGVKFLGFV